MTASTIEGNRSAAAVEPTASSAAVRRRGRSWRSLLRLISPIALLALWQIASSSGLISESKLPAPTQVWSAATELWSDGELQSALTVSLQRVAIGLVIGVAVAVILGLLVGFFTVAEYAIDPPLQMLRTVPFLGLIPLFVIWFGIGEEPKILMVALGVLFPLYLNLVSGIQGTDPKLVEAGKSLGLGTLGQAWYVVLPASLPSALTGFRLSLGVAWLSLIVAEQINADAGLGYLIMNARTYFRNDIIVLGLVIYALLGFVTDALVRLLESRLLRWRIAR